MKAFSILLLVILFTGFAPTSAQEDAPYLPIVFITPTEIYTWNEADGLQLVSPIPAPSDEYRDSDRPPAWNEVAVSPDLRYVAYSVTTPQLQDALRDDDYAARDIYLVDIASGQTRPVIRQTTAEPRSQILRWSLHWTPDSQSLIWLEEAESGNLIRYDLVTSTVTTLVENAAPYYSMIQFNTEDRIVVSDLGRIEESRGYTIYATDGTLVAEVGILDSPASIGGTSIYRDGEDIYLDTRVERVNLTTGETSPTPTGQVVGVAPDAQDTSLRVEPAFFIDGVCTSNVTNSQNRFLTRIHMHHPYQFSPDGQAILHYDYNLEQYYIVRLDENGEIEQIQLPRIPGIVNYGYWSRPLEVFEPGSEGFYDTIRCSEY